MSCYNILRRRRTTFESELLKRYDISVLLEHDSNARLGNNFLIYSSNTEDAEGLSLRVPPHKVTRSPVTLNGAPGLVTDRASALHLWPCPTCSSSVRPEQPPGQMGPAAQAERTHLHQGMGSGSLTSDGCLYLPLSSKPRASMGGGGEGEGGRGWF